MHVWAPVREVCVRQGAWDQGATLHPNSASEAGGTRLALSWQVGLVGCDVGHEEQTAPVVKQARRVDGGGATKTSALTAWGA